MTGWFRLDYEPRVVGAVVELGELGAAQPHEKSRECLQRGEEKQKADYLGGDRGD
jgi:hypothetical protein